MTLFGQWELELKNKLNDDAQLSIYTYHTGRKIAEAKAMAAKHDITITCYSILNKEQIGVKVGAGPKGVSPLKEIEWYRVVMDESHAIKTANTQQSKFCRELDTRRRWAVTGAVMQTKHDDLGMILNFLKLEPFGQQSFWNKYLGTNLDPTKLSRMRNGPSDVPAFRLLSTIMKDVVMRHMKTQIFEGQPILELPPRTQSIRMIDLSTDERKLYDELDAKALASFDTIPVVDHAAQTLRLMAFLLPSRQLCSNPSAVQEKLMKAEDSTATPEVNAFSKDELKTKLKAGGATDDGRVTTIIKSLEGTADEGEETDCSVCMDNVDEPVVTACGHVFCNECITAVITNSAGGGAGPCPACRTVVKQDTIMKLKPEADNTAKEAKDTERAGMLAGMGQGVKIKELLKSLREMKRTDKKAKAVVFSQFAKTHTAVVAALQAQGIGVVEIRGSMTQKARAKSLKTFIEEDKISVFCLSLRTGACGLTLTAASRCFLMEPCINEGTELQAMNRIHRMGQTKKCHIVTFVAKNTIEERLLQLRQQRKDDAAGKNDRDQSYVTDGNAVRVRVWGKAYEYLCKCTSLSLSPLVGTAPRRYSLPTAAPHTHRASLGPSATVEGWLDGS